MIDYSIESSGLRRFASAVGDLDSRWRTMAPPALLLTLGLEQVSERLADLPQAVLHGSTEMECLDHVNVGDRVTVEVMVDAVREHQSLTCISLIIELRNQNSVLVMRCKQLVALRCVS
ncbi:MAG: MaoC family dehydratase N-terminal domain-containing protein [Dehalococcoidia bacterium]|nr:MaoC family dehydratase N-terminal domain-containing protein [Dehalococcoidia bacterium]